MVHVVCSCGFKPSNAEWREVIAAAVEAAMSGDGVITAQEVSIYFCAWVLRHVMWQNSPHQLCMMHISIIAWWQALQG